MNLSAVIIRKLRSIYQKRPLWLGSLYYNSPSWIKRLVEKQIVKIRPTYESKPLKKLSLFPLDFAWAEAIFAPFHDPMISPSLPIEFKPINAQGCAVQYFWCWIILSWKNCPDNMDAASLHLTTEVDLSGYDTLLFCLTMSKEVSARFRLKLNNEWKEHVNEFRGNGKRMEITLPIETGILNEIEIIFKSYSTFQQTINLSWFGLQDSYLVQRMETHKRRYNQDWPGLIKPVEEWGQIRFETGLLFDEKDLVSLREKHNLPYWNEHFKFLEDMANGYLKRQPEDDLGDYLPINDHRYIREREGGKNPYYFESLVLGFVGLINQDYKMMFHALRYLMCMVHTKHWTQSAESRLQGSTWDQRCFYEEITSTSVSLLCDWYSFALTDRAKDLIRQSIWDKGLAIIERDMMKHEYLYRINQGAVFCRARILGGLILKKSWPRVGQYVDRAFSDMTQCLKNYIEKDGGVHEGIGYFCQTLHAVLPAMIAYARNGGKDPQKYLVKYFSKCKNYVSTMSGSIPGTAMVEGDCRTNYFCGDGIPILAGFFPGEAYEKILVACITARSIFAVTGTLSNSGGITSFIYGPKKISESECIVPTFSILHKTGHMASFRKQNGHSVRVHLVGSKSNPSHSHFDKGAFILEIDNVPVLIDRGMVEYYYIDSNLLKHSYMHNVITPLLPEGVYPDQDIPTKSIVPSGHGDNQSLFATIDLKNVWRSQMVRCKRSIESKTIDELLIIDEGELKREGHIAFHLHSKIPFTTESNRITLLDGNLKLRIEAQWTEEIFSREESIDLKYESVYHLVMHSSICKKFILETKLVRF